MMRGMLALLKVALNINFSWSWMRETYLRARKRLWEPVLVLAGLAAGLPVLLYVYVRVLHTVYDQGVAAGQPALVLVLAFMAGQLVVAFFSLYWLISAFYFASDLPLLIPLPLPSYAVLGSKFLTVTLNELLTVALFAVPALAVYAARTGVGAGYWLTAPAVLIFLPVIPLAAAGVLVVVLMRFINVRRSRDLLTILAGTSALAVFVAVQSLTARLPEGREAEFLRQLVAARHGLLIAVGRRFPPSLWAARAVAEYGSLEGLGQAALFLGVSLVLLVLMLWTAQRYFYAGLLSGSGVYARKAQLSRADLAGVRVSGAIPALARLEWRMLLRTPVFLLQWSWSVLILPILVLIWHLSGSRNIPLNAILAGLPDPALALAGAALLAANSAMLQLAPTAISREGRYFWIGKVIPVAPADRIRAKQRQIWQATLLSLLPTAAVLGYLLRFRAPVFIPAVLLGLAGAYPVLNLGMVLDLLRPVLSWTNPQQAMKGNLNVLFHLALSAALLGGLGYLASLMLRLGWPTPVVYALSAAAVLVPGYILGMVLRSLAGTRLAAIEQ
ncbi:MAG: putative ABC transporter permease subunit [Bacteroidota bacterium]